MIRLLLTLILAAAALACDKKISEVHGPEQGLHDPVANNNR